jgi:hypothetical protein
MSSNIIVSNAYEAADFKVCRLACVICVFIFGGIYLLLIMEFVTVTELTNFPVEVKICTFHT